MAFWAVNIGNTANLSLKVQVDLLPLMLKTWISNFLIQRFAIGNDAFKRSEFEKLFIFIKTLRPIKKLITIIVGTSLGPERIF